MSFLETFLAVFRRKSQVQQCETCSRRIQILNFTGKGSVIIERQEFTTGVGCAEQCWECGRVYCDQCYPVRPPNTCVCGRGRGEVRHIGGTVYRGSLRLVKVKYLD